jgi:hypothetical protein
MAKDHTPPETKANHKLPFKLSVKLNQRHELPTKKQNETHKGLIKQDRCADLKDCVTYDLLRWMWLLNVRGSSLLGDNLPLNP